jgi:transcriptional antiterminator RfaH
MNWYAVYTKPRWEKKVHNALINNKIEAYLPLQKTVKRYSDRIKKVEEIIIPSYVFLRLDKDNLGAIRYIDGIVNFVYWLGKPAIVSDSDIRILRLSLESGAAIELNALIPGKKITIKNSFLFNEPAQVIRQTKQSVTLLLTELQLTITIKNSTLLHE